MKTTRWVCFLLLALSFASACGDDESDSDTPTSGDGTGGGVASSGDAASTTTAGGLGAGDASGGADPGSGGAPSTTCDEGFICIPAHSDARRYVSVDASSCPSPAAATSFDRCDESACSCGTPSGTCDVDVVIANSTCTELIAEASDGCTDAPDGAAYLYSFLGDECGSTTIPKTVVEGCEVYDVDAQPCAEGVCVPQAPDDVYCIAVGIDEACPGEVYTERTETSSDGDEVCTCYCYGDGSCDDPVVEVSHDDDSCSETETVTLAPGECQRVDDVRSIEVSEVPGSSAVCELGSVSVDLGFYTTALCCMPSGG